MHLRETPRVVFVSPVTPDPKGSGGEQRAFSFLYNYAKHARVDLWYRPSADDPRISRLLAASEVTQSIIPFLPLQIGEKFPDIYARWKRVTSQADLVHVFWLQNMIERIENPQIVWDLDGMPSKVKHIDARPLANNGKLENNVNPLSRIEQLASRCSEVMVSSELEAKLLKCQTTVVPNCIAKPQAALSHQSENTPKFVFIGNMNYPPNTEALEYFIDDILPHISRSHSDIHFDVVGRMPVTSIAKATTDKVNALQNCHLHFDVASCEPFLGQSSITIAPILSGDGTRIKIIEAFANQSPVVSTSKGCEGLDVVNGRDLLIADTPTDFAMACTKLLDDSALRRKLATNAFKYFNENHTYDALEIRLKETINKRLL